MPGSDYNSRSKNNITEQMNELRHKIALFEGDRKAYYEAASWSIKKNQEEITRERKILKEYRKTLKDRDCADEHVIKNALKDKEFKRDRNALRDKRGEQAIVIMDHKVCDAKKKLNKMCYETAACERRLEQLKTEYNAMVTDASQAVETDTGESEDAQKIRNLENRLDKSKLKCQEAEHIRKTYLQVKSTFEEEHKTFGNQLDALEQDICKSRAELKEVEQMRNDAYIAKESAQAELRKHEEIVYAERRKREIELQKMKKEADEKKLQHERIERRIAARGSITQDDISPQDRQMLTGEEQQQKITTYEQAFRKIKEATGVSDTQEVVLRFENQGETHQHLEDLKKDSEKQITRLREEKEKLQQEYEEMKYTGEAKLSSGERLLEECKDHLEAEKCRRDETQEKLDRASGILAIAKGGVEHLYEKLVHLKQPHSQVQKAKIPPSSDEYVLEQLSLAEEKLLKLMEELDGKDLDDVLKQMEEEEFHNTAEHKLPTYNTRVKLPQTQRDNVYDDEDESGDDEEGVVTRNYIKRQAQQIFDAKTKKRVGKKKKSKK